MGRIQKFEDLICWQKARELAKEIYDVLKSEEFRKDYPLKDQINRASISIMLNIAEGFGRKSHKEFKHYLFMSHGSAAEVQSALYLALDRNHIDESLFNNLYQMCEENSKIISGLIKSL
jgi:four helix bundle protein